MVPRTGGFLTRTVDPSALPAWLTEADIDIFAAEFVRTGFRGGLNWYRNIDRNWELLAPFAGARVTVPALYIAGDRDLVVKFPRMDELIANLKTFVPNLTKTIMLPGCGHWTQQERPNEVNAALIAFLREVGEPNLNRSRLSCHSRASGNREPSESLRWMPAFAGMTGNCHGAPTLTTRKVRSSPSSSRRDTYSPILKAWSPKRKPSSSASALRPPFHSKAQVDPPGPPAR